MASYPFPPKAFLGNSAVLILGINAYRGDVSAVLIDDGQPVGVVEEVRGFRMCECACLCRHGRQGLRNVESLQMHSTQRVPEFGIQNGS